MLNERSQAQSSSNWMIPFIGQAEKEKSIGTRNRSIIAGGGGRG